MYLEAFLVVRRYDRFLLRLCNEIQNKLFLYPRIIFFQYLFLVTPSFDANDSILIRDDIKNRGKLFYKLLLQFV